MKIIRIVPISVKDKKGMIEVDVEIRFGFLWLNNRFETRKAHSTTGVLWEWSHDGESAFHLSELVRGYNSRLEKGETIYIQPVISGSTKIKAQNE